MLLVIHADFGENDVYAFAVFLYSSQDTLKLGVAFEVTFDMEGWEEADWQRFNDMFRTSRSQMPMVPIHTIFGFTKREEMLEFAEALPSRMPAVAGETTLHYIMEKRRNNGYFEGWYQASLDSGGCYQIPAV